MLRADHRIGAARQAEQGQIQKQSGDGGADEYVKAAGIQGLGECLWTLVQFDHADHPAVRAVTHGNVHFDKVVAVLVEIHMLLFVRLLFIVLGVAVNDQFSGERFVEFRIGAELASDQFGIGRPDEHVFAVIHVCAQGVGHGGDVPQCRL